MEAQEFILLRLCFINEAFPEKWRRKIANRSICYGAFAFKEAWRR
jgi:hypothetical protein